MRTQGVCEAGGSLCLRTAAPRPAQLPPLQRRTARAGPRGRAAKSARPGSRCESGESAVHVREREPERQAGPPYEAHVPRGGPAPRQTVMSVKSPQLSALEPLWLEAAAESESLRPRSSRARHTRCAQPSAQPAAPTVRVAARRCFPGCCQRNSLGDCAPRRATLSPANAHGLFVGSPWGLHCMRIANRAYSISGVIRRYGREPQGGARIRPGPVWRARQARCQPRRVTPRRGWSCPRGRPLSGSCTRDGPTERCITNDKSISRAGCAACKTVAYCCKEHQVEDWPAHKAACKAARMRKDAASADRTARQHEHSRYMQTN